MKCNQKKDDSACILCVHDESWQVNLVDILHWIAFAVLWIYSNGEK